MHPELLHLGPLTIRTYGALLAIAFLAATWLALRQGRRAGLDPDALTSLILVSLVSGVLGARLFYVLGHLEVFRADPLEVLRLWHGGLTLWGGFVVGIPVGLAYTKRRGLPTWKVADVLAAPAALAAAIGRVGCHFNGCCFGTRCELPWAVTFSEASIPSRTLGHTGLHPAQLYNALAGFAVFLVVLWVGPRLRAPGQAWWLFLGLYAAARSVIDLTRHYEASAMLMRWEGGGLVESQAIGIGLVLLSIVMFVWLGRRARRDAPA